MKLLQRKPSALKREFVPVSVDVEANDALKRLGVYSARRCRLPRMETGVTKFQSMQSRAIVKKRDGFSRRARKLLQMLLPPADKMSWSYVPQRELEANCERMIK